MEATGGDPGSYDLIAKLNRATDRIAELEGILERIAKRNPVLVQECSFAWQDAERKIAAAVAAHPANLPADISINWNPTPVTTKAGPSGCTCCFCVGKKTT